MSGMPLGHLLDGIAGPLARLLAVPGSPAEVDGVAILDPDDEFRDHHSELVLVIGVRGRESVPLLRAAARSGAAAVAVKTGADGSSELASAAVAVGVPVLAVRPEVRWDQLASLLHERLEAAELSAEPAPENLFELAETIAVATGGIVSIEDTGNRVLAYSRSEQGVDEMRRLSILGWQGPESYMVKLREWGVLDRLRAGERVVRVDEHPELGIRPRLAVGVRAGTRYLGTIWVQQLCDPVPVPFAPRAREALVGAARLVAAEILRRRTGATGGSRRGLPIDLLTGGANTDLVAGRLGLDPASAAVVVGFGGSVEPDAPARELHRDRAASLVSVYATAYHRTALVAVHSDRVYAVLPGVRSTTSTDPTPRSWVRDVVELVRTRTGASWWAGISSPVPTLAAVPDARTEVDRVLDSLARTGSTTTVATISELRTELLLGETLDLLAVRPELRGPGVTALVEHDESRGGELVASVLAYLDALGDVRSAAAALHVHPNTLRHRLRRARALSGVDLDDPRERLACHLQLLLATRSGA
jgi:DNA-binding PucR family transcriptional regulator